MNKNILRQWCRSCLPLAASLLALLSANQQSKAQVANYTFSQSSGTFSTIKTTGTLIEAASYASTGNTLDTKGWSVTLPFSFNFNGNTYSDLFINSNGGVTFGTTTSTAAGLISTTTGFSGAIAAMNRDLWGIYAASGNLTSGSNVITAVTSFHELTVGATLANVTGIPTGTTVTAIDQAAGTITMSANATSTVTGASVRWGAGKVYTHTLGVTPNRKFVIEWSSFADYNTAANNQTSFSFQVVLEETTNIVNIVYGDYSTLITTNRNNQVGLRGSTNADYNNRNGTTGWAATTAGTGNGNTVTRNNTVFPASGQTFTWTPPSCFAPAAGQATAITSSSANLTWTPPSPAPANGYDYYYSTSNTPPAATAIPNGSTAAGATSASLSGLMPYTTYYVWLRSKCSATDVSAWLNAITFTTICGPYQTPYTQSFEGSTFVPGCWSQATGILASPTVFGTTFYNWDQQNYGDVSVTPTNKSARINIYGTGRKDWLITPSIDLGTTPKQLEFDLALTEYYNANASTLGTDDTFAVIISTDNGATWTEANVLRSWNNTTPITNGAGDHIIINLASYTGIVKIGFYGESTVSNADNDLFVDNVKVLDVPSCQVPTALGTTSVSLNGATLSWTAATPAPANGYEYYYNTSNTAPTALTAPSGATAAGVTTANIGSLLANTTYYAWVRGKCSPTNLSAWSSPASFYTGHCIPSGGIDYYLAGISTGGAISNINYTASSGQGYVNNTATSIGSYAGNTISYTLTPDYSTNYYYIWVDWNNDLDFADAGETILATTSYTSNATGTFTVPAGQAAGNYRIRFGLSFSGNITACGPATSGNYVDYTIQVGTPPSCLPPGTPAANNVSSGGAAISWAAASPAPANGYEYYYSTSNTAPTALTTANGTTGAGATSANISGLTGNTTYYVWVRSVCSATDKSTWTNAVSFTTLCAAYATPFMEAFEGATFVPVCWIQASGLLASPTVFGTTNDYWNQQHYSDASASLSGSANKAARINIYGSGRKDWLITPPIDLGATPKQLEFDLSLTGYNSANASTLGTDDTFAVVISTDNGATWTEANVLRSWNNTTPIFNGAGDHIIISLASYTGVVKIGFYGESTISNSDNDVFIDNVKVVTPPTCQIPTALHTTTVSTNGAAIAWTASSSVPANGYEYYYGTSNVAPTAANGTTAAGVTTANIPGLTANTTYYVWVRAACSATDKSDWTNAISFYTGYCTPAATNSITYINEVTSAGAISNISNPSTGFTAGGYADYYNTNSLTALAGATVDIGFTLAGGTTGVSIYADMNNDLVFSTAERLYTSSTYLSNGANSATITIPAGALPGSYRARIITDYSSQEPLPCSFAFGQGEAEDYKIIIPDCTIPTVALGNDTAICAGATLTLNAGNSGAAYSWSTGATTQTINVSIAGTYSVTVTNGACAGKDTIVVTTNSLPVVNLGNDTAICAGNALTLNAGNAGATYLWDNATTAQTRTVTAAGIYFADVTVNGCTRRDSVTIGLNPIPVVTLGNDTAFCSGNTLTLNAGNSGASYQWDNAATTQTRAVNAAGTYFVAVTANGCTGRDTINIAMNTTPVVNLGNDTAICTGSSIILNVGSTGATYLWDNASTASIRALNTAGTYYVSVTANTCTASDTILLSEIPAPVVALGNDTAFCAGNTITLDAGNTGSTYLWDDNSTMQMRNVDAAGSYSVKVTNTDGCSSADTVVISIIPAPSGTLESAKNGPGNYTFTIGTPSGVTASLWNFGDQNTGAGSPATHTYLANGQYTVTLMLIGACDDTVMVTKTIVVDDLVGIDKVNVSNEQLTLYPNPSDRIINIVNKGGLTMLKITAYNILGQQVYQSKPTSAHAHQMDVSGFTSGMYTLKIETEKGAVVRKFEVLK